MQHAPAYTKKTDTDDFAIGRTVYIDLEQDSRRKLKTVDLRTAKFYVGSLCVKSLGELYPEKVCFSNGQRRWQT